MRPLALLIPLAACTSTPEVEEVDDWMPPDAAGAHTVGTDQRTVDGPNGLTLPVQLWFPASSVVDAPYSYDGVIEGGAAFPLRAGCDAPRPVVVFSHGNGGIRYQSIFLTEFLASHGYVVIAPDHVGNTFADLDTIPRGEVAVRRPRDVAAAFDGLVALSEDPDSPTAGCVDPDAGYAVMGHSFGGYTTLATAGGRLDLAGLDADCSMGGFLCAAAAAYRAEYPDGDGDLSDPRVWAAVPIAPVAFPGVLVQEIAVPTYVIGGIDDTLTTWSSQVQPAYAALTTTPRYLGGFAETGHYSFTDFCTLNPSWNGCEPTSLELETVHALTRTSTVAFLETVRGEERARPWIPLEHPSLSWDFVEADP